MWTATLAETPQQDGGPVAAVAWYGGQTAVANGSRVVFFDKRGSKLRQKDFESCTGLAFSSDGRALFAGSRSGTVRSMKPADGSTAWEWNMNCAIKAVEQGEGGAAVVVGESGTVALVGSDGSRSAFELGHNVQMVAASPNRKRFAAASLGGIVSVFTVEGMLQRFRIPDTRISSISMASDAKLLTVGDWSGTVRVFEMK